MSRFEETNDVVNAVNKWLDEHGPDRHRADTSVSYSLAYMYVINTEIAKSLAQLADDIHFIRETMAKKEEKPKPLGPKCLYCKHSDIINYVDVAGVVNCDVEWCHRKSKRINLDARPDCDYFEPKEANYG